VTVVVATEDELSECVALRLIGQQMGNTDGVQMIRKGGKNAPRELRSELLPAKGSIASQGFGYNSCLREFVAKMWSPTRAAERSQSLRRAINRVSELTAPNKHTTPAQGATP
jgi:hypothetical protein